MGLSQISLSPPSVQTASASLGISHQSSGYGLAQPHTSHPLHAILSMAELRALGYLAASQLGCAFASGAFKQGDTSWTIPSKTLIHGPSS